MIFFWTKTRAFILDNNFRKIKEINSLEDKSLLIENHINIIKNQKKIFGFFTFLPIYFSCENLYSISSENQRIIFSQLYFNELVEENINAEKVFNYFFEKYPNQNIIELPLQKFEKQSKDLKSIAIWFGYFFIIALIIGFSDSSENRVYFIAGALLSLCLSIIFILTSFIFESNAIKSVKEYINNLK